MARTRFSLIALLTFSSFVLASCVQAPFEPLTKSQAQDVLSALEVPPSIVKLEKETQIIDDDASQSDSFSSSYDVSEKCEAVARVDQLVYQSGWGTANKQALPSSLRGFTVREGIKFSITTPDSADDSEYVTLYASLLSFSDEEKAADFMASISSNVESCGDMKGDYRAFTLTEFNFIDDSETDFLYEYIELFDFSYSRFSIELKTFEVVAMYAMGANVLAVAGAVSEKGSSVLGVTSEDLIRASGDLRDDVEAAIAALQ